MFLERLEMENIRSYKHEAISFKDGIALFEGDIGSGKSTILYAIEFALFGLGDLKSAFLLRNGEREGRVKLSADIGGKKIVFVRSLERKKSGASQKQCYITEDGTRTDYSPEEMKARVLEILEFNENPAPNATSLIYRYAIFTPQEETKEILRLREDVRLQTLRRAFGIEEYKTARNNSTIISRAIGEREAFLAGSLKDADSLVLEKEKLLANLEKNKRETEALKRKDDALKMRASSLKKKIGEHRATKAGLDKIAGELPQLSARLGDKKNLLEDIQKTITQAQADISEKTRRLELLDGGTKPTEKTEEELDDELKKIRGEINRLSADIGMLKNSIADAQKAGAQAVELEEKLKVIEVKIKNIGTPKKPAEKTGEEIAEELFELHKQMNFLLEEAGAKKEHSKLFKKLIEEKVCPTCGEKIEPMRFIKKEEAAKKSFLELEERLKALASEEKKLQELREELTSYILKVEKLSGLLREKAMIAEAYEAAAKKSSGLEPLNCSLIEKSAEVQNAISKEKEISGIQDALRAFMLAQAQSAQIRAELASAQTRLESSKSMQSSVMFEISAISREIRNLQNELKEKEGLLKELDALEKEAERAKKEEEALAKLLGEADATIKSLESEHKKIGDALLQKDAERKEAERLAETRVWLDDYFANALSSIERHVLAGINEEFNALFQRLFRILMDENELNVNINEFFTPQVVQNGYEQEINALSGGEKTSVALAYRLALNSIVKNVCGTMSSSSLLILDEPTDGFSKEQLMRLRDVLSELACRQVIIVSHERELESFADYIYKVRKEGGISVIEKDRF